VKGDKGDTGEAGPQGAAGAKGDKGDTGDVGPQGAAGAKGDKGDTGDVGPQGAAGAKGDKGDTGEVGSQGPVGATGAQGVKGDKGDTGNVGPQGPLGATGAQGPQGPAGPQGAAGAKGDKGDTGDVGPQGPTGPQGPVGATGATGATGPAGSVFDYKLRKTVDESVSSSTTLQNDDNLKIALSASDAVEFSGMVFVSSSSATPDIKLTFTVPSGASVRWFAEWFEGANYASSGIVTASGATASFAVSAGTVGLVKFSGIVVNGSSAGDLQFQWAQNSSNSAAVKVEQRSFLIGSKF
jgi:hypothetical protein